MRSGQITAAVEGGGEGELESGAIGGVGAAVAQGEGLPVQAGGFFVRPRLGGEQGRGFAGGDGRRAVAGHRRRHPVAGDVGEMRALATFEERLYGVSGAGVDASLSAAGMPASTVVWINACENR